MPPKRAPECLDEMIAAQKKAAKIKRPGGRYVLPLKRVLLSALSSYPVCFAAVKQFPARHCGLLPCATAVSAVAGECTHLTVRQNFVRDEARQLPLTSSANRR